MIIQEGTSTNFVESDRHTELAITDRSSAGKEDEVLIPASLLQAGKTIQHPDLPFDVEVVRFMLNSTLRRAKENDVNPATTGIGKYQLAIERAETSGVDPNQSIEIASGYVTLRRKGTREFLGTYLVSTWFNHMLRPAETVTVDGKKYHIYLRAKRSYRDYQIQLNRFDHDVYPGTQIPRNYSSEIRLKDEERKENREVKIWMNHPLRYRGETFYQSGVYPLSKGTILQVVRNPGWLLPYISCALVTLGMMIHFGLHLREFLRRNLA